MGRADEHVLGDALDGADHRLGDDHPADAPAGHAEIFGETVDDHDIIRDLKRRVEARAVIQPVIDLVRDHADAKRGRARGQRRQFLAAQDGSGRVSGRSKDQALHVIRQILGAGLIAVLDPGGDADGLQGHGAQDLAIAGIARLTQGDAVAGIEKRREGKDEGAAGAGRDHHPRRVKIDPVPALVKRGDALAKLGQTQCHRIAQRLFQCLRQRLTRAFGGRGGGLAHLHMDDAPAGGLGLAGGLHHVHHDERIDLSALRRLHLCLIVLGGYRAYGPLGQARVNSRAPACNAGPDGPSFAPIRKDPG